MATNKIINTEYLNETHIVFNEKWKKYIKKASLVFELNLYNTEMSDLIAHYANIQDRMRTYLDKNRQFDIEVSKNLRKQENFAFGISMITYIDDCNNWVDVSKKFKITENYNREPITTTENYDDETDFELDATTTNCMCNHSITSTGAYTLLDLYTRKSVMLGCDCIEKTGVITKEELQLLKKQRDIQNELRKERILNSKLSEEDKSRILKNTKLKIKKPRKLTPKQLEKKQIEEDKKRVEDEENKRYKLWKEDFDNCNKEKYEMGKEDVYSQHIRKTELDKIKKRDLLIKWKGLVIKSVKHNNKIFWKNLSISN
jgi:hypothetical protein